MIVSNSGLNGALTTAALGLRQSSQSIAHVAQDIAVNGVDGLEQNLVDLTVSKIAFQANVAVIRAADETTEKLLDILA